MTGWKRCGVCRRLRRDTVLIPVFPSSDVARDRLGYRNREEPWCRPCALSMLEWMGDGEYVWRHATDGWPRP